MNTHDMVESYMVFGGIPYYLNMFEKSFSLVLNVDALCFSEDAPLRGEFDQLYETLFSSPERHVQVVKALAASRQGLNRGQIVAAIDFSDGGGLTRALNELEQCGFIRSYKAYGKNERGKLYQLCDEFSAFHLNFIAQHSSPKYWSSSIESGVRRAWSGFAFEQVCLAHVEQIKQALGISGVLTDISAWQGKDDENKGAQIDLVIERNDQVINLCEMKYSAELFQVDKALDAKLRDRAAIFRRATKTRKALHQTLVTTYGIAHNSWSSAFQSVVTMEDLLR